jgi:hypothetical protein
VFSKEFDVYFMLNLERRAGVEPASTGFADLRVNRFATGAFDLASHAPNRRLGFCSRTSSDLRKFV